jgi:hypothetical protein
LTYANITIIVYIGQVTQRRFTVRHTVPQPVSGSIETLEKILNVQLYGGQESEEHTLGYVQAVSEISICLAPLMVNSSDPKIVALGKRLGLIGVPACMATLASRQQTPHQ